MQIQAQENILEHISQKFNIARHQVLCRNTVTQISLRIMQNKLIFTVLIIAFTTVLMILKQILYLGNLKTKTLDIVQTNWDFATVVRRYSEEKKRISEICSNLSQIPNYSIEGLKFYVIRKEKVVLRPIMKVSHIVSLTFQAIFFKL